MEGSVAVFVPDRLRQREAESTAWWWTKAGQEAEPESLFSIGGVGGGVVRVRATDSELTSSEAQCASLVATDTIDARAGRVYVGSFGELPQGGVNLRRPDKQFLPLPPERYLVEAHRIKRPARQRSVHSSALATSRRELLVGGAKPAKWSLPELRGLEGFALDADAKILGASETALLLYNSGRDLVVSAELTTGALQRGAKLGAHSEPPCMAIPWTGSTWVVDKGQFLVRYDSDERRELRRINLESPIVAFGKFSDEVVTFAKDGSLAIVSMETREIRSRWPSGCAAPGALLVHGTNAIVAGLDGDIRAIELGSGATVWANELPVGAPHCMATGEDSVILVGGEEGGLCLMSAADGTVLASREAPPIVDVHAFARESWVALTPDAMFVLDSTLKVMRSKAVIRRKKDAIDPELLPDFVLVFRPAPRST